MSLFILVFLRTPLKGVPFFLTSISCHFFTFLLTYNTLNTSECCRRLLCDVHIQLMDSLPFFKKDFKQ